MHEDTTVAKDSIDYQAIRLKVGLEVHQQLATKTKLFCACPPFSGTANSISSNEIEASFPIQFTRMLRAVASELGQIDLAAEFEARREIRVRYFSNNRTSCLVEADEEPPHPINEEALETSLIFALALKSRIIDEIHVMRKIVVDGSNTSGFQRTAVVSLGGVLKYNQDRSQIAVQSVSVEEDAARAGKQEKGNQEANDREYILDRLGTPLVEVALAPIEGTPEEVQDAAGSLGRLMRSTDRIARGLGTIRQDLNVSVMNGNVIEVKGVQKLDQIAKVVQFEAARQKFFYGLAEEIKKRVGHALDISYGDVTDQFIKSESRVIKNAFSQYATNAKVGCILIRKFSGLLGKENHLHSRLGKELGTIARAYGLGGVFHSDELPNYGITREEVDQFRQKLSCSEKDAFVLLAGRNEKVDSASRALMERLHDALKGVPAETRAATTSGETVFLRPRPGAARMYPETDIPLIKTTKGHLLELERLIPESWDKQVAEFASKFKLSHQVATQILDSDRRELYEQIVNSTRLSPGFVAYSLFDTVQNLIRESVPADEVSDEKFRDLLIALDHGTFAKEALSELLKMIASNPNIEVAEALRKSGFTSISQDELSKIVRQVISENKAILREKGMSSQSMIMGKVMQKVRGKADGKTVNETVLKELVAELQNQKQND